MAPAVDLPLSRLVRYLLHAARVHLIYAEIRCADPEGKSLIRRFHTRLHDSWLMHTRHLGGSSLPRSIILVRLFAFILSGARGRGKLQNSFQRLSTGSLARSLVLYATFITYPTRLILTKAHHHLYVSRALQHQLTRFDGTDGVNVIILVEDFSLSVLMR
jgi:hypothetical protein